MLRWRSWFQPLSICPTKPLRCRHLSLGTDMRRREFITILGGATAIWPLSAGAQQPAKMKRIAFVHPSVKVSELSVGSQSYQRAFFEELIRLGYVEGQNL